MDSGWREAARGSERAGAGIFVSLFSFSFLSSLVCFCCRGGTGERPMGGERERPMQRKPSKIV
jgi:hypothetical protein